MVSWAVKNQPPQLSGVTGETSKTHWWIRMCEYSYLWNVKLIFSSAALQDSKVFFILELSAVPQFVLWPPLHSWPASLWGTVVEWISQNVTGPVPDYSSASVRVWVCAWMWLSESASSVQLEFHYIRPSLFTISSPSLPRICFNLSSAVFLYNEMMAQPHWYSQNIPNSSLLSLAVITATTQLLFQQQRSPNYWLSF